MKFTREFYIGKSYTLSYSDDNGTACYWSEDLRSGMGFSGKRQKPDFFYRFKDRSHYDDYVAKYISGLERSKVAKETYKAARNQPSTLKLGDILRSSWGYDQTNIEYWEVTRLIGPSTVEVREIAQEREETNYMQGKCIPVPGKYIGQPKRCRVQHGNSVRVHDCAIAGVVTPTVIAGCKVYSASHWTAYA